MDQIKIGKFIASCRKEEGMTQAELAEKVGTSPSYVNSLIKNPEKIVNKTFLQMMEKLG